MIHYRSEVIVMEQSRQGQEMIDLMDLVDEVDLEEDSQSMAGKAGLPGVKSSAKGTGPGAVARKTPNDYTQQEVADLMSYASTFFKKNGEVASWKGGQDWLNMIGSGMKEFAKLKKGSPNQEYKEHTPKGDAHASKYGSLSQQKADKGKASADLRGKSTGATTNRSKEDSSLLDISKTISGMKK